ncbi:MAG: thioredoxin [Oscillospiraceae bacterium]|nr:thioredoxin [Oscillospiraceae bacterium]
MIMAVIHLNKDNFEDITREGLALVDFWATWCGPCRMQAPIVDQLDAELGGSVKVCKVDVDAEPALARKFRVMSIPTLIALKDGQIKETRVGYQDLQSLKDMLK